MKTSEKKIKAVAVVCTVLFFASLGGLIVVHDSNKDLGELLNGSKLQNERILSEKLELNREIADLKSLIAGESGRNKELDKKLAQANDAIARKEAELQKRKKKGVSEKDLAELRKIKTNLESDIAALNGRIAKLETENSKLNGALADAQKENKTLQDNVKLMENMALNNIRIDATKKNSKLTVTAKRTKNLQMGFDLPQNLAENIKFKIKTPDGKTIDETNQYLVYGISETEESDLLVSIEPMLGDVKVTKRVEMSYKPKEKLKRGVYTIDIYNAEQYVSSCQIRLR